jgi:phage recombination protein Bet
MSEATAIATKQEDDRLDLIRRTICPDLNDQEFELFCAIAKTKNLDILQGHIYAIKRWSARQQCKVMAIQTGIDGYRLIAHRNGLAGIDDGVCAGSIDIPGDVASAPESVTITVYRRDESGQRDAYTATARWAEYYPGDDAPGAFMWHRRPASMLEKCAEALALRRGFQELAGVDLDDGIETAAGEQPTVTQVPPVRLSQNEWTEEQQKVVRTTKDALGIGWDALCMKVLGYTIEEIPPTRDQATQLIAWLEAEIDARANNG